MKIKYFMTILMVAVTTFFVSCANPTTYIPETPVTPGPQIEHFEEKVLAEHSYGKNINRDFTSDYFKDTGDVPREIQVTYSATDINLLLCISYCTIDSETKYENGTWVNTYGVNWDNSIAYESTDLEDKVASYLPTQDEWNMLKEKGLSVGISNGIFVKKIVIKAI